MGSQLGIVVLVWGMLTKRSKRSSTSFCGIVGFERIWDLDVASIEVSTVAYSTGASEP